MKTIRGPAIFVAQYLSDTPPFHTLPTLAAWASSLGYKGLQIPVDPRLIDIDLAASSPEYCAQLLQSVREHGVELTELSTHLQGQLIAVHPAYNELFDGFAPLAVRGNPSARTEWARSQLLAAAQASKNLGLTAHATFSGALAWPYVYPWPQRPAGLVETAFEELARRWLPILDAFDAAGVDVCYEIHPGEDVHDGVSWDRFLAAVHHHPRACILYDPSHFVLQQLDYLQFLDIYHERIRIAHIKDAEFRPDGRQGVYGGYSSWPDRAGRFRALGDGQVDFPAIFTRLAKYDYPGWAILESECAFKHPEECAREGAPLISKWIVKVAEGAFDDFAGSGVRGEEVRRVLGLE
ncbi:xylose isomerase domain protein TIM barrel [Calocera viscosa TUFC12733]|uniref:Xylose isomerase domain protein TIM barrel n=1 Tax=Calocera viscosa (strain TUFC12733) TaxID=1330018 RepID=A0A167I3Z7_CALVF|nr:xylose isomerase domain protein TIM barrel [Calocera viscosa TUFC12733]